jgi:predicted enzyme related to lactoylglutathione lyase
MVWHDLLSTDVAASKRFYSELFHWSFSGEEQWDFIYMGDKNAHFGVVMKQEMPNAPSAWVPYLAVTDIDAALASATAGGAKVLVPKHPAGKSGHFSYIQDPQGAVVSLWQYADPTGKPELDAPPPAGHFCWDELLTSDTDGAEKFYAPLGKYSYEHMEMPGMRYTLFLREAKRPDGKHRQAAGMMKMPPGVPHPHWLSYIAVADCDASVEKAKKLGANIMMPPTEIPNVGRFSTMLDPTHAGIAILGPNR